MVSASAAQRRSFDHAASDNDERPMRIEVRLLAGPDGKPTTARAVIRRGTEALPRFRMGHTRVG